jgi:hypothetical protein
MAARSMSHIEEMATFLADLEIDRDFLENLLRTCEKSRQVYTPEPRDHSLSPPPAPKKKRRNRKSRPRVATPPAENKAIADYSEDDGDQSIADILDFSTMERNVTLFRREMQELEEVRRQYPDDVFVREAK